jgi:hypothetical protein
VSGPPLANEITGLLKELLYERYLTEYLYRELVAFIAVPFLLVEITVSLHVRSKSCSTQKSEINLEFKFCEKYFVLITRSLP